MHCRAIASGAHHVKRSQRTNLIRGVITSSNHARWSAKRIALIARVREQRQDESFISRGD